MSPRERTTRRLGAGDERLLDTYLSRFPATSMFMRSNLQRAGLAYAGAPYQCQYWASFSAGSITAAIAHAWNGNLLVESSQDSDLEDLLECFALGSNRPISGLLGSKDTVGRCRKVLGLHPTDIHSDHFDPLMHLALSKRIDVLPLDHGDHEWELIPATLNFWDLLLDWELEYTKETGLVPPASMDERIQSLHRRIDAGTYVILLRDGQPVAKGGINARVADSVQIGGMWTPPPFRRRGYARYLLSERLRREEQNGVTQSILFAASDFAVSAYEAVGFEKVGVYRLLFLKEPMLPSRS